MLVDIGVRPYPIQSLPLPASSGNAMLDERGGARALERALEASEARMAKRSGRAVNGGHDGRRERQARGHGHSRADGFTEKTDICVGFSFWWIDEKPRFSDRASFQARATLANHSTRKSVISTADASPSTKKNTRSGASSMEYSPPTGTSRCRLDQAPTDVELLCGLDS